MGAVACEARKRRDMRLARSRLDGRVLTLVDLRKVVVARHRGREDGEADARLGNGVGHVDEAQRRIAGEGRVVGGVGEHHDDPRSLGPVAPRIRVFRLRALGHGGEVRDGVERVQERLRLVAAAVRDNAGELRAEFVGAPRERVRDEPCVAVAAGVAVGVHGGAPVLERCRVIALARRRQEV